eukprot:6925050-Pyramimonas_sp.AAC.1
MAGGSMSRVEADDATWCYANKEVFRKLIPRCSNALRMRRLRWHRQWANYPGGAGSVLAAVIGASKLD